MKIEREEKGIRPFHAFKIIISIEDQADLNHLESALAFAIGTMKNSGVGRDLLKHLKPIHQECHEC